jgi:hypothetical protein
MQVVGFGSNRLRVGLRAQMCNMLFGSFTATL